MSTSAPPPAPPTTGTQPPNRSWMPVTAGILSITAGAADLMIGLIIGTFFIAVSSHGFLGFGAFGVPLMIFGIIAIIGGIFAIQKKVWPLALVGAICALMWPLSVLGILAVIFVSIGKSEFR
jgi:hypothetical protein